jgi:membrane-associated protein
VIDAPVMQLPALIPMLLPSWLDPEHMIRAFGPWALWGVAFIIFAECGLFALLPGDSLLFTVGIFVGAEVIKQPLWLVCLILTVCAVLGNACGYLIGYLVGPALFKPRPGLMGRIFRRKDVDRTHDFLERYGSRALILARFVPIIRTLATFAAGVSRMNFRRFIIYTAIGGIIWAPGVTILGYFLGNIGIIRDHIDLVLVLVVVVSLIPMVFEYLHARRKAQSAAASTDPETAAR